MKALILTLTLLAPGLAVQASERNIDIPHDPNARHALLEKSGHAEQRVVVTRRQGLLGTLYSRLMYNCERQTVALLGTGESLQALHAASPSVGMLPVIPDSTAAYIASEACS